MQQLEQKLNALQHDARAPRALTDLAKVQDACRVANSAGTACNNVQLSTTAICDRCRDQFRQLHGREPACVKLPQYFVQRLSDRN